MLIVTASNKDYEWMLNISQKHNVARGYQSVIYDIDETLKYGIPFHISQHYSNKAKTEYMNGKSPYKVEVIKDALQRYPNEKCLAWIDADAFAIRRFDEIEEMDDFDIGVTLRRPEECNRIYTEWANYINAGVLFFKPSARLDGFIDRWQHETLNSDYNSDQHALNKILLNYSSMQERDVVCDVEGVRIKFFMTEVYNWYYWPFDPPWGTKIIHLKEFKKIPECLVRWADRDWSTVK